MDIFYSPAYTLAGHSFDTTRKSGWLVESLRAEPIPGIEIQAPIPATEEQVLWAHDPRYVEAVRSGNPRDLAESQGFTWDPGLWPMVLASTGGAIAAALAARQTGVAGSLSSGLHHARRDRGDGFCTFNGLALAARAALAAGAARVLILDLDAHCGGGTHSLIASDPRIWQTDIAVDTFDTYHPTERTTLDHVTRASTYLDTVAARLDELTASGLRFDLCLYNAGMDPFEGCPIGGLRGITHDLLARREDHVFSWCRGRHIPVAFVLAGGYTGSDLSQDDLVALHRLTIAAAASG